MASNNTGETILALLTGALIGVGVGMLFAPDKGSETRDKIGKEARKAQKTAKEKFQHTSEVISDKAQIARANFTSKLNDTLFAASNKADDILAAMEEKLEELRKKNAKMSKKAASDKA